MSDMHVADIRAFNRFYTRQLGLLNEHIARSDFSLAEGRVLYEIHRLGHTTGIELAQLLGVDPAYVSRIMHKFAKLGLIASSPIPSDRRRNSLALTREGDAEVEKLAWLNNMALDALVASMKTIQLILGDEPAPPAPIILRGPRIGDLGYLTQRNGILYNQQFGWDGGFEALAAEIYKEFHDLPSAPPKNLWVAER